MAPLAASEDGICPATLFATCRQRKKTALVLSPAALWPRPVAFSRTDRTHRSLDEPAVGVAPAEKVTSGCSRLRSRRLPVPVSAREVGGPPAWSDFDRGAGPGDRQGSGVGGTACLGHGASLVGPGW